MPLSTQKLDPRQRQPTYRELSDAWNPGIPRHSCIISRGAAPNQDPSRLVERRTTFPRRRMSIAFKLRALNARTRAHRLVAAAFPTTFRAARAKTRGTSPGNFSIKPREVYFTVPFFLHFWSFLHGPFQRFRALSKWRLPTETLSKGTGIMRIKVSAGKFWTKGRVNREYRCGVPY